MWNDTGWWPETVQEFMTRTEPEPPKPQGPTLWIDIETYSPTELRTAGVYRYAEDPGFEILMAAWSADGETVHVAIGEDEVFNIPGLWDPYVMKVAHNAGFERICFTELSHREFPELRGSGYLDPAYWRDTMAIGAALGYPRSLDKMAKALGAEQKDAAGTHLINWFCKPDRRTGKRRRPEDHPEKWAAFVEYCRQDVVTLIDVDRRLGSAWPYESEHRVWLVDQHINDRGMAIDVEMASAAVDAAEDNRMVQEVEISALTGVLNPGSTAQLLAWLQKSGLRIDNLQAATVEQVLEKRTLSTKQRRVLELRQDLALTASKKYVAALDTVSADGRVRGGFNFFGAHTGRWTGRGLQPHNLPRASLRDEAATDAAIMDLKMGLGGDAYTLKALVRALFTGPLTVVDYAAIEARVIAWLANERWALEAFYDGRDIYVETAERMGGLTRAQGKVAVLALGYNGSVGSLAAMGAKGTDDELMMLVNQWRRANPRIVGLWKSMERAFRNGGPVGPHITVERHGDDRHICLPSGRAIVYHECQFGERPTFAGNRGFRQDTYGGRLIENVTQAVARDVLAEALVRLDAAGYPVVAHVHDEIIVESDEVDKISDIMTEQPSWGEGLPIDGEGFVCKRYRKG